MTSKICGTKKESGLTKLRCTFSCIGNRSKISCFLQLIHEIPYWMPAFSCPLLFPLYTCWFSISKDASWVLFQIQQTVHRSVHGQQNLFPFDSLTQQTANTDTKFFWVKDSMQHSLVLGQRRASLQPDTANRAVRRQSTEVLQRAHTSKHSKR